MASSWGSLASASLHRRREGSAFPGHTDISGGALTLLGDTDISRKTVPAGRSGSSAMRHRCFLPWADFHSFVQ